MFMLTPFPLLVYNSYHRSSNKDNRHKQLLILSVEETEIGPGVLHLPPCQESNIRTS